MDLEEFKNQLQVIYKFFQAKIAEDYTQALWFQQVKHIPNGAPLKFIVDEIMGLDNLPRNVPKAFKTAWDTWMKANQDKMSRINADAKTKCDYCHDGSGLIFSRGDDHGTAYNFVSRCPRCRNWVTQVAPEAVPMYAKELLMAHGFELEGRYHT